MYVSSEWSTVYHTRIYQTCIVILPSVLCPPEGNRETRWVSQSDEIIIYNNNNKDNLQEVFSWSSIVYWVWFTTVQFDFIISINCKIFKCCFLRFLYSHNKNRTIVHSRSVWKLWISPHVWGAAEPSKTTNTREHCKKCSKRHFCAPSCLL